MTVSKSPFSTFAMQATMSLLAGAVLAWPTTVSAESCANVLASPPVELILTPEIYRYLNRLDAAECPHDQPAALETILDSAAAVNITSYVLLEGRLGDGGEPISSQLIAGFLEDYEQAQAGLDFNAMLVLADMAYYRCKGDENCVGAALVDWMGKLYRRENAACIYGLNGPCENPPDIPFLSSKVLEAQGVTEEKRDDFVCARYLDCEK
ncbi:hypothetical protein JMM61_20195 [Rhodovulum sulfidophilum]|uniref:hypothetical protein n=1 Tax=Rhodovulum sulfidophilum TaxID=35806 RepID=UPI0019255BE3|nr:hypothetical protein [Rhodovulum sulfidophilum]MBL3587637.1 hypothetical protein [Rhodovulum sulfidophilum]